MAVYWAPMILKSHVAYAFLPQTHKVRDEGIRAKQKQSWKY